MVDNERRLSQAELMEACRKSKHFFFQHYYQIPVVGKGAQPFLMRGYQKEILDSIEEHDLIIGLKARQIGWTTMAVANALHDALFNESHPWLLVSRNEDAAIKMLDLAKYAWFRLPDWMKKRLPKMENYTQTSMVFDNGSYIEAVPATGSTGRGASVYGALLDECAFMEYAEEIWGAVEPLVYGKAMLFSTANGMGNFYHEVWLDSQRPGSVWKGLFFPWDVVPTRDQDWYDHTKASYRGREWLFFQEYPQSPEEAFAKSGRVAFQADILDDCFEEVEPAARYKYDYSTDEMVRIEAGEQVDIPVEIWREPEVVRDDDGRPEWRPNYVVSADVAEGLEHGDFTYVNVFDVNTGEQVASSKSAIPVSYLDGLMAQLGYYYYTALMIPERNNAGILPIDRLHRDHWYPRMYRMDRFGEQMQGDRTPRYGWITSPQTKPKMVNDFIYALSQGQVLLHDPDFMHEAQTFVADGRGSFGATEGNHDDTIMGTLIGWQGVLDAPKYRILWEDTKLLPPTHDDIDALVFANPDDGSNANFLEQPIGQPHREKSNRKSVLLTPANFSKKV